MTTYDTSYSILFPPEAILHLRRARWDPNAVRHYDMMTGSFHWSDEMPDEALQACYLAESWAFRFILGYRASLVGSEPRPDYRPPWDQLLRECPDWPGFRPERNSSALWEELDQINKRQVRLLDRMVLDREQGSQG
jgi:hypothetical protein